MASSSREMSLGQFVKQLAGLLQAQDVPLPFKNQEPWHSLFYDLSKATDPGKPEFLDNLVFDWDAPYPKCQQLSEFLSALHFTASASARNPRFDVISLDPATARRWCQQAQHDEPNLKAFVTQAATLATKEFCCLTDD
jgi:hypothetical protein